MVDFSEWVDGTPQDRLAFARRLGQICHKVGFFQLVNHDVDLELQKTILRTMQKIFQLPQHEKERIAKIHSPWFRGWEALGTERTNGRVDLREQVDTWTDCDPVINPCGQSNTNPEYKRLYGPSQYFSDDVLPGYKDLTLDFSSRCKRVADELLSAMAVALDLPADYFQRSFGEEKQRMSLTKYIHYPGSETGQHGVNAHKDSGILTLLLPYGPGLEIQLQTGEWIPVKIVPGAFVVNLGEILQSLTGQYFVATPHRVVTTRERYSCAYFHGPSLDFSLAPIKNLHPRFAQAVADSEYHRNARFMALQDEIEAGVGDMAGQKQTSTYGHQLWEYLKRAYPDIVRRHTATDQQPQTARL